MIKTILGIAALCLVGLIGEARAQTPVFGVGDSNVAMWCLNSGGTAWIPAQDTVHCAGGGGGGGAATIADGADVAQGAKADAAYAGSGSTTVIGALKGLYAATTSPVTSADGGLTTIGSEADAAYAGSGSTTVVGALKGIYSAAVQPLAAGSATIGAVNQVSQYPATAVAITASATGTTAATAATLAHVTGHTVYICGFSIRANATAAITGNSTVAGTITGTLNFTQWTAPLASGIGLTEMIFNPCVPASGINTDIVTTSAAPGSGGVVSTTAWGYSL